MNTIAGVPLVVGQGVEEFVKDKGIEDGFARVCDLCRESYTGVIRLEAKLRDDVNEIDRRYVLVLAILPMDYPLNCSSRKNGHTVSGWVNNRSALL